METKLWELDPSLSPSSYRSARSCPMTGYAEVISAAALSPPFPPTIQALGRFALPCALGEKPFRRLACGKGCS